MRILSFFQLKRGFGKFGYHRAFGKITQIGSVFGILFGQRIKIAAFFQFGDNFLGRSFIVNQNMFGLDFLFGFEAAFIFVVKLVKIGIADILVNLAFDINFFGQFFFSDFQLLFIFFGFGDFCLGRCLVDQFGADRIIKGAVIIFIKRHLRFNLRVGFISLANVADRNFFAVDNSGNAVFAFGR